MVSRRDFRFDTVITIDPITAQDLDDALHIKLLETSEGVSCYEIGVHIADVTYFVQPGTELDQCARRRATSVYLVDKVCFLEDFIRLLTTKLHIANFRERYLTFVIHGFFSNFC